MAKNKRPVRRSFTEDFKKSAVQLIVAEGYSFRAASEAVDVSDNCLRRWYQKYAPEPEACGPDSTLEQLQQENRRLRKQLRRAELEREILPLDLSILC